MRSIELFDDLARVSGRKDIGGDLFGDHAAGPYDAPVADGHSWADDRPSPDPGVVTNGDGCAAPPPDFHKDEK